MHIALQPFFSEWLHWEEKTRQERNRRSQAAIFSWSLPMKIPWLFTRPEWNSTLRNPENENYYEILAQRNKSTHRVPALTIRSSRTCYLHFENWNVDICKSIVFPAKAKQHSSGILCISLQDRPHWTKHKHTNKVDINLYKRIHTRYTFSLIKTLINTSEPAQKYYIPRIKKVLLCSVFFFYPKQMYSTKQNSSEVYIPLRNRPHWQRNINTQQSWQKFIKKNPHKIHLPSPFPVHKTLAQKYYTPRIERCCRKAPAVFCLPEQNVFGEECNAVTFAREGVPGERPKSSRLCDILRDCSSRLPMNMVFGNNRGRPRRCGWQRQTRQSSPA